MIRRQQGSKQRKQSKRDLDTTASLNSNDYASIVQVKASVKLDKPTLIMGFMDDGMIGSICINGIIEQLTMHQMAFVESQFIMPGALFVNRKFRHPFRIYANDAGSICASVCEVPVMLRGVTFVVNALLNWVANLDCSQVIVVGGIPTSSFTPSLKERKCLLLQNMPGGTETNHLSGTVDSSISSQTPNDFEGSSNMVVPESAILPGLQGAILSACAARKIRCTALMIPTMGYVPDPEGGAIALESLKEIIPSLQIDTTHLRKQAEMIRKQLEEFMKMHQRQMAEYQQAELGRPGPEGIYK